MSPLRCGWMDPFRRVRPFARRAHQPRNHADRQAKRPRRYAPTPAPMPHHRYRARVSHARRPPYQALSPPPCGRAAPCVRPRRSRWYRRAMPQARRPVFSQPPPFVRPRQANGRARALHRACRSSDRPVSCGEWQGRAPEAPHLPPSVFPNNIRKQEAGGRRHARRSLRHDIGRLSRRVRRAALSVRPCPHRRARFGGA